MPAATPFGAPCPTATPHLSHVGPVEDRRLYATALVKPTRCRRADARDPAATPPESGAPPEPRNPATQSGRVQRATTLGHRERRAGGSGHGNSSRTPGASGTAKTDRVHPRLAECEQAAALRAHRC